jgi:hypothetical protein
MAVCYEKPRHAHVPSKESSFTDDSAQTASNYQSIIEDLGPAAELSYTDDAWRFLQKHHRVAEDHLIIDLARLRRKIDWHIVPLMFCCYTLQFLDKVILNVSEPKIP